MMREWLSLFATIALIGIAFCVLRLWQRRRPPPSAEMVRKAAHVLSGVIAAAFPWLFQTVWSGVLVCGLALIAMIGLRLIPVLRRTIGRVTGSVERRSWGEVYFPLAVGFVWVSSNQDPMLFAVPVLMLTFGDAAAALVGVTVGRHKFRTTEGHKSVEGSLTFLAVSTAVTLVALLVLRPDLGIVKATLVAILLASLLMVFEAIAWRGLDNLLLPIMGFGLLRTYIELDTPQLAARLAAFSMILGLLVFSRERRTLTGEGVFAAALFLYSAWALGGWPWLVPPAIVVLASPWLPRNPDVPSVAIHGVLPVLALSATGLILLFAHTLAVTGTWSTYVASFAAALSVVTCIQLHPHLNRSPTLGVLLTSIVLGVVLVALPGTLFDGDSLIGPLNMLSTALASSMVALCVAFIPVFNRLAGDTWLWLLRGIAVSVGSACAAGLNIIMRVAL